MTTLHDTVTTLHDKITPKSHQDVNQCPAHMPYAYTKTNSRLLAFHAKMPEPPAYILTATAVRTAYKGHQSPTLFLVQALGTSWYRVC